MDEKDRLFLSYLQNGLPLVSRPFDVLSAKIGVDSAELLVRIQRLKKEGAFGGIKAVLDPRTFHYQNAWVAAMINPEECESRAEIFWKHPGVVYSCEREHEFNCWFFVAIPAAYDLGLHVRCLEKLAGVERTLFLPVCKVFKGTDLLNFLDAEPFPAMSERFEKQHLSPNPAGTGSQAPCAPSTSCGNFEVSDRSQTSAETVLKDWLSAEEIGMIRQLQEPFPLTDEPYRKIAADLGITETQALERIRSLEKKGCLKRIGSFLKSAMSVPSTRVLVVWQIPEEKLERVGPEIAGSKEVLYADQRPACSEFPYSLYTMIRAGTPAELEALTKRVQDRIGKWPCRVLAATREFKKERMKYFPKELDEWWRASRHGVETAFH